MNKNTVYVLQKDLPFAKAGVDFIRENEDADYYNTNFASYHDRLHKSRVENNPEWFKPKEQVNESKPTEQFQWDENLAREFGDLCNQEGWHHFSGKKNIDTLLEQFKQSKSKTAPKEEQVPIKVSHITSHDAINFRDKTVYSHAVWVSQPIPESKYQFIMEAIERELNNDTSLPLPLIDDRQLFSMNDIASCYESPKNSPLYNTFQYNLYRLLEKKIANINSLNK